MPNSLRLQLTSFFLALGALASCALNAMEPSEMTANLCRSGGGAWTIALPITVENKSSVDFNTRPITLTITRDVKDRRNLTSLIGQQIEALRVCNSDGAELLFNVKTTDETVAITGVVQDGYTLTFPATVGAKASATYYVFYGNERAYYNLDCLEDVRRNPRNLDFEEGKDVVPIGWRFDDPDSNRRMTWRHDAGEAFSGEKCVRCDVATGADPSWIAARQTDVALEPGARYKFSARVRGKDVAGRVGWYLHLGNSKNAMLASPMLYAEREGDFDWIEVAREFTVDNNIDRLEFGTVLYGTGTAWYDDAKLERLDAGADAALSVEVGPTKALPQPTYALALRPDEKTIGDARVVTIKVDAREGGERLVMLDRKLLETRWGRALEPEDFVLLDLRGKRVRPEFYGDYAFFNVTLTPNASHQLYLLETSNPNDDAIRTRRDGDKIANQAFPGTSLQVSGAEETRDSTVSPSDELKLPEFVDQRNLISDGGFENVDPKTLDAPKDRDGESWTHDAAEPGVTYEIFNSGVPALGARSLRVAVDESATRRWRGWRRVVKIEPGQSYLFGYALATDTSAGAFDMHLHWLKGNRSLADSPFGSLGKSASGKTNWSLKSAILRAPNDAEFVEIHLTNHIYGVAEYDDVFALPVNVAEFVEFGGGKSGVFQVPAVAKVFSDTTFAANEPEITTATPATCALALDEQETLQIACRATSTNQFHAYLLPPKLTDGDDELPTPELFVVSNVLVDYPTNYYQSHVEPTMRKFPSGSPGCDGWIGYWPDPMIPVAVSNVSSAPKAAPTTDDRQNAAVHENDSTRLARLGVAGEIPLAIGETRAILLRVRTSAQTKPGKYQGALVLSVAPIERNELALDSLPTNSPQRIVVPYTVNVLNFTAPATKITGIYDARISHDYFGKGTRREKLDRIAAKLLESNLSSDRPIADLKIKYDKTTGKASADWREFDAAYARYYDELGAKAGYFPDEFYLFGWGNPPKIVEGETPYPGEWPYDGADRSQLRPEYKRAYQAKLKLFWDHLKAKGWADKCVLYISDEPFYSKPEIIKQMQALCDMIHEVDPAIPIYSSTWVYVPEWLRYLDVWGIGHYGAVSEESLATIRNANGRIWWTTDGMMCLDTPLCAVERLLPYTCVKHGAELYEFWGASWYTCNPFDSASHFYISQSDQPGVQYYIRYPNGDGYIFYPGELIGRPGEIIDSIRSEQAREGVEDAGWLVGLQNAIAAKTAPNTSERARAQQILDRALNYLPLNCGSGRYSTRYIADPKEFEQIRLNVGLELEKLSGR